MGWWAADLWSASPVLLVSWVFWTIASITLHELGHGWTAIRLGDDTPIHTGHMTVNPIVHMGPMSLVAFALLGMAWGSMPIDPSRLKGRFAEAMVAAAGPSMNIGLAVTCLVAAVLVRAYLGQTGASADVVSRLHLFFAAGSMSNIVQAVFNLIPVTPLDGSRILGCLWKPYARFIQGGVGQGVMFIALGVMCMGMGRALFPMAAWLFREGSVLVNGWLP